MMHWATPPDNGSVSVPPLTMSAKLGVTKRTDPVGTPLFGACSVTVGVRVTGCPLTEGFAEEAEGRRGRHRIGPGLPGVEIAPGPDGRQRHDHAVLEPASSSATQAAP